MKQQLSALIDGEGDLERSEHLLLAAQSDGDVARAWREYHLIGDVMRGDNVLGVKQSSSSMASRVLAQLEHEPTVLAPKMISQFSQKLAQKKTAMWSVAASVAASLFVALFVWNIQSSNELEPVQIAEQANDYVNAHHIYAPNSATYYIQNGYMQNVAYAE